MWCGWSGGWEGQVAQRRGGDGGESAAGDAAAEVGGGSGDLLGDAAGNEGAHGAESRLGSHHNELILKNGAGGWE